jgi:hypothetical protein
MIDQTPRHDLVGVNDAEHAAWARFLAPFELAAPAFVSLFRVALRSDEDARRLALVVLDRAGLGRPRS